ncbi:DUF982 domain-containing protein, partial [Mesorhizobium sp. M7A.F.Ca.ET.027.03.2.1]|uniref:DUF982 domain-containing protein n=1 Tax=Mesorhizobium sp. M7A.F.Ca.ET.027.03.2.1 TaxID=2496656 RepID=UPI0032AF91BD
MTAQRSTAPKRRRRDHCRTSTLRFDLLGREPCPAADVTDRLSRISSGDLRQSWRRPLNDKMFPRPIRLKFAPERERIIRSAWEGLECLGDWPSGQGRRYRAALRSCRDALDG